MVTKRIVKDTIKEQVAYRLAFLLCCKWVVTATTVCGDGVRAGMAPSQGKT